MNRWYYAMVVDTVPLRLDVGPQRAGAGKIVGLYRFSCKATRNHWVEEGNKRLERLALPGKAAPLAASHPLVRKANRQWWVGWQAAPMSGMDGIRQRVKVWTDKGV